MSTGLGARRRLDYLTAAEVEAYLSRSDAALVPVGPTEAHGVHVPLGCDCLVALATATRAAEQADALVFPPFSYSWPGATSSLPGTIPVAAELVLQVLVAIGQGALAKGFRRLAFVSAHAPDAMTVTLAARRLYELTGTPVLSFHVGGARNGSPRLREAAEALQAREREDPGAFETSLLAAAVQLLGLEEVAPVRMDLPAPPPVPALEGDRRINRPGAAVGRYFTHLSQHIPKPRALALDEAHSYLDAAGDLLAELLADLGPYLQPAAEVAARVGHR